MTVAARVVNAGIRNVTRLLCRVDDAQLARVPDRGPLILVANHINFLEVPLVYTHLQPRPVTGFAKAETWNNPAMARLFDLWGAIPLRRGEIDMQALRRALSALKAGHILAVAPEGTRSGDGRLQRGHAGVVLLAQQSGAPLLPIVYYGGEKLKPNLVRMRRTSFHIGVGHPFYLRTEGVRVDRHVRQQMTDEIMYQLAALLPLAYRGCYSDLSAATEAYLSFPLGSMSNLCRAADRPQAGETAVVVQPSEPPPEGGLQPTIAP
jgi:1-acyl-sn-glycerol-3-phosphate acyltransferase